MMKLYFDLQTRALVARRRLDEIGAPYEIPETNMATTPVPRARTAINSMADQ